MSMLSRSQTSLLLKSLAIFVLQAAWSLKTRALTEMVYIDEVEVDQEGIAEMMLDESSIAQVARKFWLFVPPFVLLLQCVHDTHIIQVPARH